MSGLVDAETVQRGFLLTGKDLYLEPYNRAVQEIPIELASLHRLLPPATGESDVNVARLDGLVDQKMAELRETIDLRRKQGVTPAMEVVLSDRGYTTFSSFERETYSAVRDGGLWTGMLNVVSSVMLGYIAVTLGSMLAGR